MVKQFALLVPSDGLIPISVIVRQLLAVDNGNENGHVQRAFSLSKSFY